MVDNNNDIAPGGFAFDNVHRNALIQQQLQGNNANNANNAANNNKSIIPLATKTGTTIVGLVYANGVILGADTRSTNDTTVADKNCDKIHYIAPNIYCCGAGTAADTEKTTELISSQMELLRLNTSSSSSSSSSADSNDGGQSRVITACTLLKRMLFRYQGHISAALVLGGCDIHGPHLYQIYPHGSTGKLPYTTMGSGSLAAMACFESDYTDDMTEEAGLILVQRAILAGIYNDLGSGSNVDTCIIRLDGSVTMGRNAIMPNNVQPLREKVKRSTVLNITSGTTAVLKSTFYPAAVTLADVTVTAMET
jgi:20S proteasome subunit beta 2